MIYNHKWSQLSPQSLVERTSSMTLHSTKKWTIGIVLWCTYCLSITCDQNHNSALYSYRTGVVWLCISPCGADDLHAHCTNIVQWFNNLLSTTYSVINSWKLSLPSLLEKMNSMTSVSSFHWSTFHLPSSNDPQSTQPCVPSGQHD